MHFTSIAAAVVLVATASAGSLQQVQNYASGTKAQMWIYVPDNVVPNPPLVVVIHSCQSTAQNYFNNAAIPWRKGSDAKGYITVWPSSPNSGTCWDVSSRATLQHDGAGSNSNDISKMITYAVNKYQVPQGKVFVTGGSSGAMMTNVLASTYPNLINATSLYSGVPAGCFVSSSGAVAAWNNTCSGGQSTATPAQWGNVVRAMYPGYTGPRPRMQIWHGSVDQTLNARNYDETIKQWTNVFGVSQTATKSARDTPERNYVTNDFGPNVQGIYATGVGHSVPSHLQISEAWFGL